MLLLCYHAFAIGVVVKNKKRMNEKNETVSAVSINFEHLQNRVNTGSHAMPWLPVLMGGYCI